MLSLFSAIQRTHRFIWTQELNQCKPLMNNLTRSRVRLMLSEDVV